jgi:hypothetical protein
MEKRKNSFTAVMQLNMSNRHAIDWATAAMPKRHRFVSNRIIAATHCSIFDRCTRFCCYRHIKKLATKVASK